MAGDWLKLHRKIIDSPVFAAEPSLYLWIWLLVQANWARRELADGTVLEPGQLIASYRRIADSLHWSKHKAEIWMGRLITQGKITTHARHGTLSQVITICNWDTYQDCVNDSGTQGGRKGDTSGDTKGDTSGDIKKKGRSKEGKKKAIAFVTPTVEDVRTYCQEKGYGFDPEEFIAHYTTRGWKLKGGIPMEDWKSACLTWHKNEGLFSQANQGGSHGGKRIIPVGPGQRHPEPSRGEPGRF